MTNQEIISRTIDALTLAKHFERRVALLLVRNLHNMQECKYRCNDGNDHVIVRIEDGSYVFIAMSNEVLFGNMIESGNGDVIAVTKYQEYGDALRASLEMQKIDAGL